MERVSSMKGIRNRILAAALACLLTAGSIPASVSMAEPMQVPAETIEEEQGFGSAEAETEEAPAEQESVGMEDIVSEIETDVMEDIASEIETDVIEDTVLESDLSDSETSAEPMKAPAGGFADVQDSSLNYYDAVYWAADQGILVGTEDGYFGVDEICTLQQTAAALWKAAGQPVAQTQTNPFTDVSVSAPYYPAVLWMAEEGLLDDSTDGRFGVGRACSRRQLVTFLWKLAGRPLPQTSKNPFQDLTKADASYNAALWAVENGMLSADQNGAFAPDDFCLKQQLAVALYKYSRLDPETFYLTEMPVAAAENQATGVRLTWNPVPGAEVYRVYRKIPSGSWQRLGDTALTTYLDKSPEENTTYYYTVRCISADGKRFKSYFDSPGAKITTLETILRIEDHPGLQRLEQAKEAAEAKVTEAQESLAACQEAYGQAQEALAIATQTLEEAKADPEGFTEDQILELEAALQNAQTAADEAAAALEAAQEALAAAEQELTAAEEGLTSYTPVTGISQMQEQMTLATEQTAQIAITLEPENASEEDVTWTSSDEEVASVDEKGLVTAHTWGQARISAVLADGTQLSCTVDTLYYDVTDTELYYYTPVYWAAEQNITKGFGNVYFGPEDSCTREQMVMFLWRMAGKPAPLTQNNPFSDVKKSDYFYKAVLWAVDEGITKGYDDGTFGVGKTCLREHLATFLWRIAGSPLPRESKTFTDVKESDYYYNAVLWAAENAITKGYSDGSFGPEKDCLRQHTVTFLYRYSQTDPSTFYLSAIPQVTAKRDLRSNSITWTAVPGAEKYRLYRKKASGSWERLTDITKLSYVDQDIAVKTTYYYTVRCITADGSQMKSSFQSPGAKVTTASVFPKNEAEYRQLVVENADSYIGIKGQSLKHRHIIDVFNTLQPDGAPMYYYSEWCAAFASAVTMEVLGNDVADKYFPLSYNCGTIIRKAVVKDIWKEKDSYVPKPGDWIIYDWDDSGSGEDITGADHVGIVKSVSGTSFTVIEGNKSNACGYRTMSVNGRYIRGFVTPDYAKVAGL